MGGQTSNQPTNPPKMAHAQLLRPACCVCRVTRKKTLQANCHPPPCRDCKLKVSNLQLSFNGMIFRAISGFFKNGVMLNSLRVMGCKKNCKHTQTLKSQQNSRFFLEQTGLMQSHHPVTPRLVGRKLVPIRPLPSQHPVVEVEMHPGKTAFRSRRQRWEFSVENFRNLAMNAWEMFYFSYIHTVDRRNPAPPVIYEPCK